MASILVLDDRAVEHELLETVLGSVGHTLLHASNGESALALAQAEHPDLIVADVLMPGMDGYEFVRALRADPDTAATRVILCTATYDEDEVRRLALACGVSHVMIKPVDPAAILSVVEAALSAAPAPIRVEPVEPFGREQLRGANAKLIEKVAELERAKEVRQLLAAVVESSDDAIIAKTLEGIIVSWNRGAEELYGYTASEAVGRSIAMLVPPERPDELPTILEQIKRGRLANRLETVRLHKDGKAIDVALTISPIYSDAGELTGAATIARDISVRKEAERELARAHRTAVETARAKSQFVANMSHEIRTPLNGVVGMTGLLGDTPLDQLQQAYVDALAASSEALLVVVNEVLDFSKLEAGRLELASGDFDCRGAVEEALLMLAEPAKAKGLEISHRVESDVPATVRGDRARLRQILLNLLSNAVKFTASGEILLRVCVDRGHRLRFTVSDTGVGIDASRSASLFEAFAQEDQSTTRRYGGTGLGLAISRELVKRMGGEIGAESRDGGGATFWFTAELPASTSATGSVGSRLDLLGLRALIVGDGEIERTTLENYLRERGLACNGVAPADAIETLERASADGKPFELAILDFDESQMSCVELTRAIRERPALGAVRVVMLSASALDRDALEGAGAGVSIVIERPAGPSAICDAIGDALDAVIPAVRPAAHTDPIRASKGPRVLLAEDNEINRTVAEALLAKRGLRTAIAVDGRQAVEMAGAHRYAAILMDCQMPELDGYEATQLIREAERGHHTPIIAMTAHSMPGDRERCLAAGMDDYLAKPVRAEALDGVVERWLTLDSATISQLKDTLSPEMRSRLLDTFEQSATKCIADIESANARGDPLEIRRLTHLLTGSSATLGAAALADSCQRLERLSGDDDTTLGQSQLDELGATFTAVFPALRRQLL
jgi:two-component system sensor histidine kinase/response regulator